MVTAEIVGGRVFDNASRLRRARTSSGSWRASSARPFRSRPSSMPWRASGRRRKRATTGLWRVWPAWSGEAVGGGRRRPLHLGRPVDPTRGGLRGADHPAPYPNAFDRDRDPAANLDQAALDRVKASLGVPPALRSCHTARVEGYVVEGHVPAGDILLLLDFQPEVRGVAAPAMLIGSQGMEMGDETGRMRPTPSTRPAHRHFRETWRRLTALRWRVQPRGNMFGPPRRFPSEEGPTGAGRAAPPADRRVAPGRRPEPSSPDPPAGLRSPAGSKACEPSDRRTQSIRARPTTPRSGGGGQRQNLAASTI